MTNKDIFKKGREAGFKESEIYLSYKIFFSTLVSEPRLKIINLLRKEKKNVSEIIKELKMNQSAVSHNLARLKSCGFVEIETKGKFRYYGLNSKTIKPLLELIDRHMSQHCIHILKKMKKGK